MDVGCTLN